MNGLFGMCKGKRPIRLENKNHRTEIDVATVADTESGEEGGTQY